MQEPSRSGSSSAVVLVKALPQASEVYGETVCVAAVDEYGRWLRLYPVTFRELKGEQQFGRWDRISFKWRLPEMSKDRRAESRHVERDSFAIEGELKPAERQRFLGNAVVGSTRKEHEAGRSLALVSGRDYRFFHRPRDPADLDEDRAKYARWSASPDLFGERRLPPREPAPYAFFYSYRDDDGPHECRCHDWEMEATFFRRRQAFGEQGALASMVETFGEEYPRKGMLLAMGTHSRRPEQWMIVGVIRLDPITQGSLF